MSSSRRGKSAKNKDEATTLGLAAARTYLGTLQSCTVANPDNARLNLSYEYEPNGNISQMVDSTRSETLNYTYDELDRLLSVGGAYNQGYTYNTIGNITAKGSASYTYSATHKHAVASLSTGESYSYDANGNMTTRVEGGQTYTQTFNAENRLVSVSVNSQITHFVYDGDGNLVKKLKPDGTCTIYPSASLRAGVGGVYEVEKAACGGAVTHNKVYYPAGGAMRVDGTLYFVLKDHLGSASVVTDEYGDVVGDQRYYPFGETRVTDGDMLTDRLFTGQREMEELGIYHYGARFYSQKLGRFLSADTLVPGAGNPQAFNRYSYVMNNPIQYTDPSGHICVMDDVNGRPIKTNCETGEIIRTGTRIDDEKTVREKLAGFGVQAEGYGSDLMSLQIIYLAVLQTGWRFYSNLGVGNSPQEAFIITYGTSSETPLIIKNVANFEYKGRTFSHGCVTRGPHLIECADIVYPRFQSGVNNVVHELGHAFNQGHGGDPEASLPSAYVTHRNTILHDNSTVMWQANKTGSNSETFADMFVAWIFGVWGSDADTDWDGNGGARQWLMTNMADWVR